MSVTFIHIPGMTRIDLFTSGAQGGLVGIRVGKPIGLECRCWQTFRARDYIRHDASQPWRGPYPANLTARHDNHPLDLVDRGDEILPIGRDGG